MFSGSTTWQLDIYFTGLWNIYPLVMTNSSPWKMMAHRNRWFTVLNSMVIFHGYVIHNQMVLITNQAC